MHAALDRFWAALDGALPQPPDSRWRMLFTTAVVEIAANIARHAHPPEMPPRWMRLRLFAYPDRVEARFSDRGIPYGLPLEPTLPAPDLDVLDLDESGRGMAITRAAVDELHYRRTRSGANSWRLVKFLS